MILHQWFLSLRIPMLSNSPHSLIREHRLPISPSGFFCNGGEFGNRRTNFLPPHAAERESEFEVDPDKAREALRKLDEQLKSISERQIDPPKIRASELDASQFRMREAPPELDESSLPFIASALLIFSIFYNIFFITVIKPSIDIPNSPTPAAADPSVTNDPGSVSSLSSPSID